MSKTKTPEQSVARITDRDVLDRHLTLLVALDPDLKPVLKKAGLVPLRLGASGFAGLARIVNGQLLSVASAKAINARFETLLGDVSAQRFLALDPEIVRECGLSRAKYKTMRHLAEAEMSGGFEYDGLGDLPVAAAMKKLTALPGIGPWTAEIYLLSSIGHADIFPSGDLVLQKMVALIAGLESKPDTLTTARIAAKWSPYRASAARLLWQYFAVLRDKEGIIL